MKTRILVVEDDAAFGLMIQTWLKKNGYEVVLSTRYEQAKAEISSKPFSLILTDLRLPDGDGIILMSWVREKMKSTVPFIVMTGYAEVQTAVSAMKLGAFDYLKKPINPSVLEEKIVAALASTGEETEQVYVPSRNQWVRGNSPAMQRLYKHVELVAPTKFSVLILGESGTGKEYIARMIHDLSQNREGPFIPVDCGSLSKELERLVHLGHRRQKRRFRASQGRNGVPRRSGQPALRGANATAPRLAGTEGEACRFRHRHQRGCAHHSRHQRKP